MPKVLVNGVKLNYMQFGTGPDLIMIHGLGANMAFWYPQIIAPLQSEFKITIYELKGHGRSDMPASGYTAHDMATDLHCLTKELDIKNPHLLGHSFGGNIALQYAIEYPYQVRSLILADAVVRALHQPLRLKDWPYWKDVMKERFNKIGLSIKDENIEVDAFFLNELAKDDWKEARKKFQQKDFFLPFSTTNGGEKSAKRWQSLLMNTKAESEFKNSNGLNKEKLSMLQCPTLVTCGEYSTSLETFETLKRTIPGCKTYLSPGVGHFHPIVRSDVFTREVKKFLKKL